MEEQSEEDPGETSVEAELESYLLELTNCKIPDIPLFNEDILPEWNIPFTSNCEKKLRLATITGQQVNRKFSLMIHL